MEFRRMEETDLEQVVAIEKEAFSQPWTKEAFLDSLCDCRHVYAVACEGDVICGYAGMWGVAGEGQINNVAVKSTLRGKGIGFELLQYLLKEGEEKGLEAFTLEVRESNTRAIHVYEKAGFQSVGVRKDFYDRPKENAVIMWR